MPQAARGSATTGTEVYTVRMELLVWVAEIGEGFRMSADGAMAWEREQWVPIEVMSWKLN